MRGLQFVPDAVRNQSIKSTGLGCVAALELSREARPGCSTAPNEAEEPQNSLWFELLGALGSGEIMESNPSLMLLQSPAVREGFFGRGSRSLTVVLFQTSCLTIALTASLTTGM